MSSIKYLIFCWLSLISFAFADSSCTPISASLISETRSVQPGHSFWVAIDFDIEKEWHLFWKNPGDCGLPISVEWNLPKNVEIKSVEWVYPQHLELEGTSIYGYENQATLLVELFPASDLESGTAINIESNLSWLACSHSKCQPGSESIVLQLPVLDSSPELNAEKKGFFSQVRERLPMTRDLSVTFHNNHSISIEFMSDTPPNKVEFFPEHPNVIESDSVPQIAYNDNTYSVHLKTVPHLKNHQVKGVLVLHTGEGSLPIHIDTKLSSSEIALLDKPLVPDPKDLPNSDSNQTLLWAILFAFLGGACLNLMPCVLPVLSFKVMNFVKMSQQNRWVSLKHGALFTLGILVSFWILTAIILVLQFYGESVGWGFQLQEPLFVAALAMLLFLFALSQFGMFEIGLGLASIAGEAPSSKSENINSFFSGVLATVVATPCTGPFLGSAVGLAVTLPVFSATLIFTSVALGLSAPYLVLSGFPALLKFIPRPGPWMETFKQFLGFLLMATVLWLLWVFNAQTNFISFFSLIISLFFLAVASWIYGQWSTPLVTKKVRLAAYFFATLCVGISLAFVIIPRQTWNESSLVAQSDGEWEVFSPERVAELQKQGVPVFVDFTAKWCLICQANHFVLTTEQISEKFKKDGVVLMKADWTRNDPIITQELAKFGRNSVPLYLLYGNKGTDPEILPQVLTPDVVLNSLENAISH